MWLWSSDVAVELARRGRVALADQLAVHAIACRFDGPPLAAVGDTALELIAAILLDQRWLRAHAAASPTPSAYEHEPEHSTLRLR